MVDAELKYKEEVSSWVRGYLAKAHPDLGRSGAVCPFTPEAITRNSIAIKVVRLSEHSPEEVERVVLAGKREFVELPSAGDGKLFKALMMVFPDVQDSELTRLIDETQKRLKLSFVSDGLMLGEFHAMSMAEGLHNRDFRPLRSPYPMLVIRNMVSSDVVFLNREMEAPPKRLRFLEAYLAFHKTLQPRDRAVAEEAVAGLRGSVCPMHRL